MPDFTQIGSLSQQEKQGVSQILNLFYAFHVMCREILF